MRRKMPLAVKIKNSSKCCSPIKISFNNLIGTNMKKTLLFLVAILSFAYSQAVPGSWGREWGTDSLLYELSPKFMQRGARVQGWIATDQYIQQGQLKYQVMTDSVKQEKFAILNEADTALKGDVTIPQFIHTENGKEYEVRGLGLYAFYLGHVTKVTLPESVEYIGDGAFFRCYPLLKLNIPEKVHTIGNWAFAFTGINAIRLPENLVSFGELVPERLEDCFYLYRFLKYLYIGANIKEIRAKNNKKEVAGYGYYMLWQNCPLLEAIEVSPRNEIYGSINGVLVTKKDMAFRWYPQGKRDPVYQMPDDIKKIDLAFEDPYAIMIKNDHVQVFQFSNNIDSLKDFFVFDKCENLRTIILPSKLKYLYSIAPSYSRVTIDGVLRSWHQPCLQTVYAQNPIPSEYDPTKDTEDSYGRPFGAATLMVPKGSKDVYMAHPVWSKVFKEIKEYDEIDYSVDLSSNNDLMQETDKAEIR